MFMLFPVLYFFGILPYRLSATNFQAFILPIQYYLYRYNSAFYIKTNKIYIM